MARSMVVAGEEGVRVPAPSSDEEGTGWIFSETPGSAFAFFLSSSICFACSSDATFPRDDLAF